MKKIVILFLCIILLCSLPACDDQDKSKEKANTTSNTNNSQVSLPEGPYAIRSADWPVYSDAEDLINAADIVFVGKITNIEFQVLDSSNALPVSESTSDYARTLYTIYTVEISTTYKGDTDDISKIRVMGGMVDYEIENQLKVMEEGKTFARENGIPIWDNYYKVQCSLGSSYLFVLRQFETGYPTIVNLDQAVFGLEEPTLKNTIGNNSTVYYSGQQDEKGNPLISAHDIISSFGTTELNSFYEKWNKGEYTAK